MKTRIIDFSNEQVDFRQDYFNIAKNVAISAEGVIFKIGDVVGHSGSENKEDRATITHFTVDEESVDIIAHTERGFGRISFMYHPE